MKGFSHRITGVFRLRWMRTKGTDSWRNMFLSGRKVHMGHEGWPSQKRCKLIAKAHPRHNQESSQRDRSNSCTCALGTQGYKLTTGASSGNLRSMGSHRVWHDWSNLAAAAAAAGDHWSRGSLPGNRAMSHAPRSLHTWAGVCGGGASWERLGLCMYMAIHGADLKTQDPCPWCDKHTVVQVEGAQMKRLPPKFPLSFSPCFWEIALLWRESTNQTGLQGFGP